jgi:hypothetical protein
LKFAIVPSDCHMSPNWSQTPHPPSSPPPVNARIPGDDSDSVTFTTSHSYPDFPLYYITSLINFCTSSDVVRFMLSNLSLTYNHSRCDNCLLLFPLVSGFGLYSRSIRMELSMFSSADRRYGLGNDHICKTFNYYYARLNFTQHLWGCVRYTVRLAGYCFFTGVNLYISSTLSGQYHGLSTCLCSF